MAVREPLHVASPKRHSDTMMVTHSNKPLVLPSDNHAFRRSQEACDLHWHVVSSGREPCIPVVWLEKIWSSRRVNRRNAIRVDLGGRRICASWVSSVRPACTGSAPCELRPAACLGDNCVRGGQLEQAMHWSQPAHPACPPARPPAGCRSTRHAVTTSHPPAARLASSSVASAGLCCARNETCNL